MCRFLLSDEDLLEAYGQIDSGVFPSTIYASAIPQVSAAFSAIAALVTFVEAHAEHKSREGTVISTVVMACQITTFIGSLAYAFGPTPAPAVLSPALFGAQGTILTCRIQGALLNFGATCLVMFDFLLTTCYLLIVRCNWTNRKCRKLEKVAHGVIWPVALAMAITPWPLNAYHASTQGLCWIQSVPTSCSNIRGKECVFGESHKWFYLVLASMSVITMLYSIVAMVAIYLHVWKTEERSRRFSLRSVASSNSGGQANFQLSKETAYQGILHASTFLITSLPLTITNLFPTGSHQPYDTAVNVANAAPGILTMIVYLRPRKMRTRFGRWTKSILTILTCGKCFCCPGPRLETNDPSKGTRASTQSKHLSREWGRRDDLVDLSSLGFIPDHVAVKSGRSTRNSFVPAQAAVNEATADDISHQIEKVAPTDLPNGVSQPGVDEATTDDVSHQIEKVAPADLPNAVSQRAVNEATADDISHQMEKVARADLPNGVSQQAVDEATADNLSHQVEKVVPADGVNPEELERP